MRSNTAIAMIVCATCLPSLAVASNFFEDLVNHTKEQVKGLVTHTEEQISNEINQATQQIDDKINQPKAQLDKRIDQTKKQISDQIGQVRRSTGMASDFSGNMSSGMNVIGLYLGMTPQKAKAVLQAHNAAMRIEEKHEPLFRMPDTRYLRHISATANTGEHIRIEFAPPPHESVAIKLSRTTKYAQGARPTLANTLQALEQKYGAPTQTNNTTMMHQLSWLYDKTANKVTPASADLARHCAQAFVISVDQLLLSPQLGDTAIAECGENLNIHLTTDVNAMTARRGSNGHGLVTSLTATLDNTAELIRIVQKTNTHIGTAIQMQAENVAAPKL